MISETTRTAILAEAHRAISESASAAVAKLGSPAATPDVLYPPNESLTPGEREALRNLQLCDEARSGLSKVIRDCAAGAFFEFFCIMDGVADPPQFLNGEQVYQKVWVGVGLASKGGNAFEPMLHDEF